MKNLLYKLTVIMEVNLHASVHIVKKKSLLVPLDIGIWGIKSTLLEINRGVKNVGVSIVKHCRDCCCGHHSKLDMGFHTFWNLGILLGKFFANFALPIIEGMSYY